MSDTDTEAITSLPTKSYVVGPTGVFALGETLPLKVYDETVQHFRDVHLDPEWTP